MCLMLSTSILGHTRLHLSLELWLTMMKTYQQQLQHPMVTAWTGASDCSIDRILAPNTTCIICIMIGLFIAVVIVIKVSSFQHLGKLLLCYDTITIRILLSNHFLNWHFIQIIFNIKYLSNCNLYFLLSSRVSQTHHHSHQLFSTNDSRKCPLIN